MNNNIYPSKFYSLLQNKINKSIILSLIFNCIAAPFVLWIKFSQNTITQADILTHLSTAFSVCCLFFLLLLFLKRLGNFLILVFFGIAGCQSYYLFNFGKAIDAGVILDFLSVEYSLISEYITIFLVLSVLFSVLIGYFVLKKININNKISVLIFLASVIICFILNNFYYRNIRIIAQSHSPYNILYSIHVFCKNYFPESQARKNKVDISSEYKFTYSPENNMPKVIVFVIGESMRGDLISLNGYQHDTTPLLRNNKNLISFDNVKSSATVTRVALPYMLTRAEVPNFEQSLKETSIISVFKKLGFKTSWIGNHGLFGIHETSFASIALEADYVLTHHDLKRIFGKYNIYDISLISFIKNRIEEFPNDNHFIVMHMIGSHWNFSFRYPQEFKEKFTPTCKESSPVKCDVESLVNSYLNTLLYSDYVLDRLLNYLSDKNSFVYFSSDHGFSLGENKVIGNAATENIPNEQTNIAMFVWGSNTFLSSELKRKIFRNIKNNKHHQLSHSNIFHSILDCNDIKSDIIVKNLSICNINSQSNNERD